MKMKIAMVTMTMTMTTTIIINNGNNLYTILNPICGVFKKLKKLKNTTTTTINVFCEHLTTDNLFHQLSSCIQELCGKKVKA